jgi:hypothetical protein
VRVSAYRLADGHEFRDIESPFPEFEFRHERLTLPDPLSQFSLCYTGVLSRLHQQLDHAQIKVGPK